MTAKGQSSSPEAQAGPPSDQGERVVPVLTTEDMRRNILIGVCGVEGAGKTVFLTAVFQTMQGWRIPGIGRVTFDRTDKGGASYFEAVESFIRRKRENAPTREPVAARLIVTPESAAGGREDIGILLFDFAGGLFTQFADLKEAARAAVTEQEKSHLAQVHAYLDQCDAFIILVDAQRFTPFGPAGAQNPFPSSIKYLKEHCLDSGKPLALVFTKRDRNQSLTSQTIESFPIVQEIRQEFGAAGRFGLVELISCYRLDNVDEVVQERDGSIWTAEPRDVFIQMLRAAWTSARQRIKNNRDAEDYTIQVTQKAEATRKLRLWVGAGLMLLTLLSATIGASIAYREWQVNTKVGIAKQAEGLIRAGRPHAIPDTTFERLELIAKNDRDADTASAWIDLQAAVTDALTTLPTAKATFPALDPGPTRSLLHIAELVTPGRPEILLLRKRQEVQDSLAVASKKIPRPRDRLKLTHSHMADAAQRGDEALRRALDDVADGQLGEFAGELVEEGGKKSRLLERVQLVRVNLAPQNKPPDPRATLKKQLARFLGASLSQFDGEPVRTFLSETSTALKALDAAELQSRHVLHFERVQERLRDDVKTFDASADVCDRLMRKFGNGTARAAEVQEVLETTLESLFDDLNEKGRALVWTEFFAGIDGDYVFVLQRTASSGNSPVKDWLRTLLARRNYGDAAMKSAREAITRGDLYASEIRDLASLLWNRHADFIAAAYYRDLAARPEGSLGIGPGAAVADLLRRWQDAYASRFGERLHSVDVKRNRIVAFINRWAGPRVEATELERAIQSELKLLCESISLRETEGICAS
jgi:hypothetical protein